MNRRAAIAIFYAILLACTAAVFLPVRHFQFVNWDDRDMVVENPLLNPPTLEHLQEIWSGPHLDLYTQLSYSLWWGLAWTSNVWRNARRFSATIDPIGACLMLPIESWKKHGRTDPLDSTTTDTQGALHDTRGNGASPASAA